MAECIKPNQFFVNTDIDSDLTLIEWEANSTPDFHNRLILKHPILPETHPLNTQSMTFDEELQSSEEAIASKISKDNLLLSEGASRKQTTMQNRHGNEP